MRWLQQDDKSVPWLLEQFRARGFANHVASWISREPNRALTASDITHVLDADHLVQLGERTHRSSGVVAEALAHVIPALIDRLTPLGTLFEEDLLKEALPFLEAVL